LILNLPKRDKGSSVSVLATESRERVKITTNAINVGGDTNYRRLLTRLPLEITGPRGWHSASLSLFFRTDTTTNGV